MPDAQYAPQFWTGVANAFKGNDAVVFDLFNEPYPDMATDWNKTLRLDSACATAAPAPASRYQVAGMQDLVNAVRATGATNVLMIGGLDWTNDLTPVADLQADRPAAQPRRVVARVQLQRLRHRVLLGQPDRSGRAAGAARARRVRPERLRLRLHATG